MTCCTGPDANPVEEVKFRPIGCNRQPCGDFSLPNRPVRSLLIVISLRLIGRDPFLAFFGLSLFQECC
jgi:hypothetical protein